MTFEEWIKDQPDGYYSNDAIFQAGAASRDAEFARLRAINSKLCEKSNWYVIHTARLEEERDQLRAELVKALAACKVKDAAITEGLETYKIPMTARIVEALAIQPDDSALKAFMQSKGVSYE